MFILNSEKWKTLPKKRVTLWLTIYNNNFTTKNKNIMNPLTSIKGTITLGFVLALLAALVLPSLGRFNIPELTVWLHVISGITWIGLLYYFKYVLDYL